STWGSDEYLAFQKGLRDKIKEKKPLEWEARIWIEVADKRQFKEIDKADKHFENKKICLKIDN
ncbi:MAG: hypothetical protein HUJ74_04390, partial [Lachnospiraceae bacterium]|nr:hypothetical protein [Lachnospiraceae bacterium]